MRFYGQFNPPVDQVLYERYFPDKRDGFFIECGAYDGLLECSCRFFEETMGWKGINIEASPRIFNRLVSNRPKSFLNVNVALSNENGRAVFQDIVSPTGVADGNGSLTHCLTHKQEILNYGCGFNAVEIETIKYADLVKRHDVGEVNLMVLDVEGHEIQVIEGMIGAKTLPDIICVEFPFSGQDNIKQALGKLGYKMDFISVINAFFLRGKG